MIVGLCDRWHKLPSEVLVEPATAIRLLRIYERGHWEPEGGEGHGR